MRTVALFSFALVVMMSGSFGLSRSLERVAARYDLSSGVTALLTALGADAPEITAAFTALLRGERDVGVGVILGSNLFNIAALMGMGAVIANGLTVRRGPLIINGAVSLAVTIIAALALYHVLPPPWTVGLLDVIFVVYLLLTWFWRDRTSVAPDDARSRPADQSEPPRRWPGWKLASALPLSLAAIVAGAIFIVRTAIDLWTAAGLPRPLAGSLMLAVLSSLPNAYTSAQLARRGRGTAVVGETISSNTINVIVGIGLPALALGLGHVRVTSLLEIWWLLAMTAAASLLPLVDGHIGRGRGLVLIGLYLAFVAVRLLLPA
jgi:cation:H+ antiporter